MSITGHALLNVNHRQLHHGNSSWIYCIINVYLLAVVTDEDGRMLMCSKAELQALGNLCVMSVTEAIFFPS